MNTAQLSAIPTEYVRMVNSNDPAGFIALFADNAVVNDAGREIHGIDSIRQWSESDVFAVNVSLEPLKETFDNDTVILTAKVDGDFDRTGLPNPLIIVHRFTMSNYKITRLACTLAE